MLISSVMVSLEPTLIQANNWSSFKILLTKELLVVAVNAETTPAFSSNEGSKNLQPLYPLYQLIYSYG